MEKQEMKEKLREMKKQVFKVEGGTKEYEELVKNYKKLLDYMGDPEFLEDEEINVTIHAVGNELYRRSPDEEISMLGYSAKWPDNSFDKEAMEKSGDVISYKVPRQIMDDYDSGKISKKEYESLLEQYKQEYQKENQKPKIK